MAQLETNNAFTVGKIPPFLNNAKKPDMTVKRYWSRFRTYQNLTQKIRVDPLLIKQKKAVEKGQQVADEKDRAGLDTALDAFKWVVTGQETEK